MMHTRSQSPRFSWFPSNNSEWQQDDGKRIFKESIDSATKNCYCLFKSNGCEIFNSNSKGNGKENGRSISSLLLAASSYQTTFPSSIRKNVSLSLSLFLSCSFHLWAAQLAAGNIQHFHVSFLLWPLSLCLVRLSFLWRVRLLLCGLPYFAFSLFFLICDLFIIYGRRQSGVVPCHSLHSADVILSFFHFR